VIAALTWNVLHRIHAENWAEPTIDRHPDEAARIAGITERIAARTEAVIALQEVSGDLLASLRRAMPTRTILDFRYPRIPRPRSQPTTLVDAAEHLVVLVQGNARPVAAETSRGDYGKGLLAVATDELLVVDTHVTYGEGSEAQLARLREIVVAHGGPAIVLGDFNAARTHVALALGDDFVPAIADEAAAPTRPRQRSDKASSIDHVFAYRCTPAAAHVEDARGLSDHNLVWTTVTIAG
jgi:endonuclease/exonuclease/phosphatase family metal-dependent hydrolase